MSKSKINWSNHFIELLVVVIGISIAFAMENWAEKRRNRNIEVNYLTSLKEDISNDKFELLQIVDSSQALVKNIDFLMGYIFANSPLEALEYRHITSTYASPYFNAQDGTYHSLVNSGALELINNYEVRAAITDLYNFHYDEITKADDFLRDLVNVQIYPYMISKIEYGNPSMGQTQILDDSPLKTNQVRNMVGSFYNLLKARSQTYTLTAQKCDSLINRIDQELTKLN